MAQKFPEILSELRKENGLSQRETSQLLGVSQALMSHYENGLREPGLDFVCKAAKFYNVSTDYLLGQTDFRGTVFQDDISAGLDEKLLCRLQSTVECIGALMLLIPVKNQEQSAILDYMDISIYRIFREIHSSENFSLPDNIYSQLCDIEQKFQELKIGEAAISEKEIISDTYEKLLPWVTESIKKASEETEKILWKHLYDKAKSGEV